MTKLELHIVADSAAELRQAVSELAQETPKFHFAQRPDTKPEAEPVAPAPSPTLPPAAPAEQPPVEAPAQEPVAAKRTRTKKDSGDGAVAVAPAEVPVTIDNVRQVFNEYRETYGVDAAMEDGPVILARIYGADVEAIRDIPANDQKRLIETAAQVRRAIEGNEFKRGRIVAETH